MGRQTRKWSSKMPIFVSFARYIFGIFIPRLKSATHSICVNLLHKHDKLAQCCRAFTLALARLSCLLYLYVIHKPSVLWHCWLGITATLSSLASLKSREVYLSGASLPRFSWKRGRRMGTTTTTSLRHTPPLIIHTFLPNHSSAVFKHVHTMPS